MPNPGDLLIGRYRILERLGSGGMATVHRARDERLERDVAVKVLLPNLAGDPATAARFEREARSLAASSHPGVVAVFDVDAGDPASGREPFFVMELCAGGSLADRLSGGRRMAPDDLIPILVTVADGLADLHRRGIVHRDVKPQNILFGDDRAKLADFGLAQSDDGQGLSELTSPGTTVGTLAYLAPEVLAGARATTAADVYGLGVVAFVGLTGAPPRPATSMADLVAASTSAAPSVSTVAPVLGPAFDDPIGRALAIRADDRPDALTFASGLASALGRWTRDGGPARRAIVPVPQRPPSPPADASLVGVGRPPAGEPAPVDEDTTVMAIPLGQTASMPLEAPAVRTTGQASTPSRPGAAPSWLGRAIIAAALVLVVALAIIGLSGAARPGGPGGASTTPTRAAPSASIPAASPSSSVAPSASVAPPSPGADPALEAMNTLEAALSSAKGGPDGIKGKEANDLQARLADVRTALDAGDRRAALDAARELDKRIHDLDKGGGSLRDASAALVRALGG